MRKFTVWLDKNVVGAELVEQTLTFPDDMSDEDCDKECEECLEVMLSNEIDTGWMEI